jgi:four helix bundle protein
LQKALQKHPRQTEETIPIPIGTTARGSTFECVAVLDLLQDEQLINAEIYEQQIKLADELSRLLYAMIKNLAQ